jgi:hypothetical protein
MLANLRDLRRARWSVCGEEGSDLALRMLVVVDEDVAAPLDAHPAGAGDARDHCSRVLVGGERVVDRVHAERRRGRIATRTDRWYALLSLMYVIGSETHARLHEVEHARWVLAGKHGQPPSRGFREQLAHWTDLGPSAITNAVKEAERRGFLQREFSNFPRPKNLPGGLLTEAGWAALGTVPPKWSDEIGSKWEEPASPKAEAAMRILGREMAQEQERARNEEKQSRAQSAKPP